MIACPPCPIPHGPVPFSPALHRGAIISLMALIALGLLWELWLAPLRPGGSWMVLKILPLFAPLRGVWRASLYTLQWAAMLSLLYLMEGVVRAWSDPWPLSAWLGGVEALLALVFYLCAIFYVRPAKLASKAGTHQQAHGHTGASDKPPFHTDSP